MKLTNFERTMLDNSKQEVFTFVNPYSYYILDEFLSQNQEYNNITIFVDGISLVYINNLLERHSNLSRYSFDFTSLAPIIFRYCIEKSYTIAIVGGEDDEIKRAVLVINEKFPGLNIKFFSHGYVDLESNDIYEKLVDTSPDVILSGMGTPLQEKFIFECKKRGVNFNFAFTCGGFISQISTNPEYFHPIFDKLNLRWLQRFFRHSYVRKRMCLDYPKFFLKFVLMKLREKK
ncbi:TPA: WecB/TagA/CpsF family glycosyltransferase [Vibrio vulnificus]|nr:hypothetical protein [Vibrio vulnificus]HAT8526044.1 hypothetical protein [Vibrio vulnificus]HDY7648745.1 WecB/TagA/CpsF family glycosyltransferase [Vibrio vulnificus]